MRIPCLVSALGFVLLAGCFKAPTERKPPPLEVETPVKSPAATAATSANRAAATPKYWQELARIVQQAPGSSFMEYGKACYATAETLAKLDESEVDEEALSLGKDIARWFNAEGSIAIKVLKLSQDAEQLLKAHIAGAAETEFLQMENDRLLVIVMAKEDKLFEAFYLQPKQLLDRAHPRRHEGFFAPMPAEEEKALQQRDEYLKQHVDWVWSGKPLPGESPPSLRGIWSANRLRLAVLIYDHAQKKQAINDRVRAAWQKLSTKNELAELPALGEGLVSLKSHELAPGLIAVLDGRVPGVLPSGHTSRSLAFSPDGKTLVSGGFREEEGVVVGHELKAWDVDTRKEKWSLSRDSEVSWVVFSPDGKNLAEVTRGITSRRKDGSASPRSYVVSLWNTAAWREKVIYQGRQDFLAVAFSLDGTTLAMTECKRTADSREYFVLLKDVSSGQDKEVALPGITGEAAFLKLSSDGKTLASIETAKSVKLWDAASGKALATFAGSYPIAFSRDGKTIALGSDDHGIKIWDVASGKNIASIENHHHQSVYSLEFSPDGMILASAGALEPNSPWHSIRLWDVATGKQIAAHEGHRRAILSISFSPDGKMLASGSDDRTIKLWNVEAASKLR